MVGDRRKQRVDCLFLNLMRWVPIEPLSGLMFSQLQLGFFVHVSQKIHNLLLKDLVAPAFVSDRVFDFVLKIWVDLDLVWRDTGFFMCFAEGGFQVRLLWFTMTFG